MQPDELDERKSRKPRSPLPEIIRASNRFPRAAQCFNPDQTEMRTGVTVRSRSALVCIRHEHDEDGSEHILMAVHVGVLSPTAHRHVLDFIATISPELKGDAATGIEMYATCAENGAVGVIAVLPSPFDHFPRVMDLLMEFFCHLQSTLQRFMASARIDPSEFLFDLNCQSRGCPDAGGQSTMVQ
jgi:hypothetical protein